MYRSRFTRGVWGVCSYVFMIFANMTAQKMVKTSHDDGPMNRDLASWV